MLQLQIGLNTKVELITEIKSRVGARYPEEPV